METVHGATTDTARANEKSTENAVCILRNLSYRLAAEVPDLKAQLEETLSTDTEFMDCFQWRKSKKKNAPEVGFPRFHRVPGTGKLITDGLWSKWTYIDVYEHKKGPCLTPCILYMYFYHVNGTSYKCTEFEQF